MCYIHTVSVISSGEGLLARYSRVDARLNYLQQFDYLSRQALEEQHDFALIHFFYDEEHSHPEVVTSTGPLAITHAP